MTLVYSFNKLKILGTTSFKTPFIIEYNGDEVTNELSYDDMISFVNTWKRNSIMNISDKELQNIMNITHNYTDDIYNKYYR